MTGQNMQIWVFGTPEKAIEDWNRRAEDEERD